MKNILLILFAIIPVTIKAQELVFRLEGNVDIPIDTMGITIVNADTKEVLGKTQITKGEIIPVEGKTDEPAACFLDTDKGVQYFSGDARARHYTA